MILLDCDITQDQALNNLAKMVKISKSPIYLSAGDKSKQLRYYYQYENE